MTLRISKSIQVPLTYQGQRLDYCLHTLFPDYSRAQWQRWIDSGQVTVDGSRMKPKKRLKGLELVQADCQLEAVSLCPQTMPLTIAHEDNDLLVINKPPGLVVHPGAGCPDHTLVNGLLAYCPALQTLPRAGLIHRLDKDTSGLLIIAKSSTAYIRLIDMMRDRQIHRHYQAIVEGQCILPQVITTQMGRHPIHRTKMAVLKHGGKTATTRITPLQTFTQHSHLRITLETGRTHQIRVHLAHLKHPIVSDTTYGSKLGPTDQNNSIARQALHAYTLTLTHPISEQVLKVTAPLPEDMQTLLNHLRRSAAS